MYEDPGGQPGGNEYMEIWVKKCDNRRWAFLPLPVRTPTRIWWSWFVKIIPSDAMFSSAVARTENSRQGPEPIASNLAGRGRGEEKEEEEEEEGEEEEMEEEEEGWDTSKKKRRERERAREREGKKQPDEMSREPSDHRDTYR